MTDDDDEKNFARKALFVIFSGNYVAQIRDDIGLDCTNDKEAIFLLLCGEYFFLENRTCRPSVLLLQVRDMVDTFRKQGHEEGILKADIVEKYLFEVLEEFTTDRTNYYMHFLHELGANSEMFNLISDRYMNLRHLLNDRFDMDFEHVGEFIRERNLTMPKIFGYEDVSPPYLKILCDFFEGEGCPELFQRTNLIYLANVQILKERIMEN